MITSLLGSTTVFPPVNHLLSFGAFVCSFIIIASPSEPAVKLTSWNLRKCLFLREVQCKEEKYLSEKPMSSRESIRCVYTPREREIHASRSSFIWINCEDIRNLEYESNSICCSIRIRFKNSRFEAVPYSFLLK